MRVFHACGSCYLLSVSAAKDGSLRLSLLNTSGRPVDVITKVVDQPQKPLAPNEAFVVNFGRGWDIMRAMRMQNLAWPSGKAEKSGYYLYDRYRFNLDRLRDYDPSGVSRFVQNRSR